MNLEWRGRHLWLQGLWIGQVIRWGAHGPEGRKETPYRGWLMTEEDGDEVGWFKTEDDAKIAVKEAAEAALDRSLR
jgi:hypothetical protein